MSHEACNMTHEPLWQRASRHTVDMHINMVNETIWIAVSKTRHRYLFAKTHACMSGCPGSVTLR
jgi:hypothetical protein